MISTMRSLLSMTCISKVIGKVPISYKIRLLVSWIHHYCTQLLVSLVRGLHHHHGIINKHYPIWDSRNKINALLTLNELLSFTHSLFPRYALQRNYIIDLERWLSIDVNEYFLSWVLYKFLLCQTNFHSTRSDR